MSAMARRVEWAQTSGKCGVDDSQSSRSAQTAAACARAELYDERREAAAAVNVERRCRELDETAKRARPQVAAVDDVRRRKFCVCEAPATRRAANAMAKAAMAATATAAAAAAAAAMAATATIRLKTAATVAMAALAATAAPAAAEDEAERAAAAKSTKAT